MKRFIASLLLLALSATGALAMSQSSVPPKFPTPWGNSAGSSYIRSIPQNSQIGIQNCAASLTDGFPPLTFTQAIAGGCPPDGRDFNGILKQTTQWNQWQGAGASVIYDSGFSSSIGGYPKGAVLSQSANAFCFWISQVDNNATNPDASGAGWTSACPGGGNGGTSTGSANAQVVTTTPFVLQTNAKACFTAGFTNSGALKINVNSGGLTNVLQRTTAGLAALVGGEVHVGMSTCVIYDGTQFELDTSAAFASVNQIRVRLTAPSTFNINSSVGVDQVGCGLGTGTAACLTPQFAIDTVSNNYDLNAQAVQFLMAATGVNNGPFVVHQPWVGASFSTTSQIPNVILRGANQNVTIDGAGGTFCAAATNYGTIQISTFTVQNCANEVSGQQYGSIYFSNITFGTPAAVAGASSIYASRFGYIEAVGGGSIIMGVRDYFMQVSHHGNFRASQDNTGPTVFTLGANITPSVALAYAASVGDMTFTQYSNTAFNVNGFTVGGQRWSADSGGVIQAISASGGLSLVPVMFLGATPGFCVGSCQIDQAAHNNPTVNSCGSSPAFVGTANDYYGTVQEGSSATGCGVAFHSAFSSAPKCVVTWDTGQPPGSISISTNTTQIGISHGSGSVTFSYHCEGS